MPTVLIFKNLLFVIHTRDHGHPHVTVYAGTPKDHEAMAKIRLDALEVIESVGFNQKALNLILQVTLRYQTDWLEVWNDIHEE
jgi:hypothetical protein